MKNIILTLVAFVVLTKATNAQNIFTNPLMNGTVGQFQVPTDWVYVNQHTDISTGAANGLAGSQLWGTAPGSDFDGTGQFVSGYVYEENFSANEAFGQTVNGLTIGDSYNITFAWGNFGGNSNGFSGFDPIYLEVSVDGTNVHTTAIQAISSVWYTESFNFTATNSSHEIAFSGNSIGVRRSWWGVDAPSVSLVPEPSSIALLGFGGLALLLRRKK